MTTTSHLNEATIEADPSVPLIRITRDFDATPTQLFRAHTDEEIFRRWVGPDDMTTEIDYWDARDGGSWRFLNVRGEERYAFRGCFHEVSLQRIVQTFAWEDMPKSVSLQTLTFEDLGDGCTRLHVESLVDSFDDRDAWLRSGMEIGVNDGYRKLDEILADASR